MEPQYSEWPRDWQKCALYKELLYIKVLSCIFYYQWGRENHSSYRGLRYIEVHYVEFHCTWFNEGWFGYWAIAHWEAIVCWSLRSKSLQWVSHAQLPMTNCQSNLYWVRYILQLISSPKGTFLGGILLFMSIIFRNCFCASSFLSWISTVGILSLLLG